MNRCFVFYPEQVLDGFIRKIREVDEYAFIVLCFGTSKCHFHVLVHNISKKDLMDLLTRISKKGCLNSSLDISEKAFLDMLQVEALKNNYWVMC